MLGTLAVMNHDFSVGMKFLKWNFRNFLKNDVKYNNTLKQLLGIMYVYCIKIDNVYVFNKIQYVNQLNLNILYILQNMIFWIILKEKFLFHDKEENVLISTLQS